MGHFPSSLFLLLSFFVLFCLGFDLNVWVVGMLFSLLVMAELGSLMAEEKQYIRGKGIEEEFVL